MRLILSLDPFSVWPKATCEALRILENYSSGYNMSETNFLYCLLSFLNFVLVRDKNCHLFRNKNSPVPDNCRKIERRDRKYLSRNFIIRQTESRKGRMSGILREAPLVLGETAWRSKREGGGKAKRRIFQETRAPEAKEEQTFSDERRKGSAREGSRARTRRKRKEGDEKGERGRKKERQREREGRRCGGRRDGQTGWRVRRTREEWRRVGQFSLKISRRQWPKRARRRDVKGGCWELQAGRQAG